MDNTKKEMKNYLKACANFAGIDDIGVCDEEYLKKCFEKLTPKEIPFSKGEWSDKINYKKIRPTAKCVVSFIVSYNYHICERILDEEDALLSKVTLGRDYHHVLREKGQIVLNLLKDRFGIDGEVLVDTNPLFERLFAAASGIGSMGDNGFFISPVFGSFVNIGLLLLDIELDWDKIAEDVCLHCKKCIASCKNKALRENNFVYERCVAYQNQNHITEDYASDYLYGCDICQNACPLNVNAHEVDTKEGLTKTVDLREISSMTNSEIVKKFQGSSMLWRGAGLLRRNAKAILALRKIRSEK